MKSFLIAGNWKMNTSINEAIDLSSQINNFIKINKISNEVLVCPPSIWLKTVRDLLNSSELKVGSQNCYFDKNGAFTGEISIKMLEEANIDYSIIGHSERRQIFKESDELINLKLKALLSSQIKPILCIGETLDERQNNKTFDIIENQISMAFSGIDTHLLKDATIAYEPIWAIGTGISATKEQAQEVHKFIRDYLLKNYNEEISKIKILYGGSLNDKNAEELLNMPDIDGGLIGGASLKADSFIRIIEIAEKISIS